MVLNIKEIVDQRTNDIPQNGADGRQVSAALFEAFRKAHDYPTAADITDPVLNGKLMLFQTILGNMAHDAVMARFSDRQLSMGRRSPDMPDFGDLMTYYAKPYIQWLAEDKGVDLGAVTKSEDPAALSKFLTGIIGRKDGVDVKEGEGFTQQIDPATGATYGEGYQAYVKQAAEQTRDMLKHGLQGARRIAVTTPHPTELLIEGAIDAVRDAQVMMKDADIEWIGLDALKGTKAVNALMPTLEEIWEQLAVPTRRQTPIEEVQRGLKGGRNYHDAVPEIMSQQRIAIRELEELYDLTPSPAPSVADLRTQYELLRLEAWEGSDQDGKELATAAVLAETLKLDETTGAQWFADSLQPVLAGMQPSTLRDQLEAIQAEAATPNSAALQSIIADLARHAVKNYIKLPDPLPNMRDDADLILKALEYVKTIAEAEGTKLPAHIDRHGVESDFTALDVAIVQRGNFHEMAKRQQIRQNAEVHDTAIEYARALLARNEVLPADLADESAHSIESLLETIMTDAGKRAEVRAALEAEIERLSDLIGPNVADQEGKVHRTAEEEAFYQTVAGMRIASDNPDKVPLYLIAESKGTRDILNPFFLLKAIADPAVEETKGHVEVASLLEHRPDIEQGFATTRDVMENKHFRAHHDAITRDSTLLQIYDPATKVMRPRTVADEKRRNNMTILEGDELKEIKSVKIVMWAGSDSFRGSGVGISPILVHAERDTTEAGLNLNPPVLIQHFRGAGGSPHRAAPTFATEQTRQGNSLRHDGVQEIADLSVAVVVNNIGRTTGNPQAAHRGRTGEIGVGGIASGNGAVGAKLRPKVTDSSEAGAESYEADMHDARFAEYLKQGSASHMIKKVNFSSRASDRPAKPGEKPKPIVFPPAVDPEKTRAIEFGLTLAASGSCASLTRSVSKILLLEKGEILSGAKEGGKLNEIAETFLRSPEVQDELIRTYVAGYAMADRPIAWKFAGAALSDDKQSVTFRDSKLGVEQTRSVTELAQMYEDGVGLKDGKIDLADPRLNGIPVELLMAAHDEEEFQHSEYALITLMADINKKQDPDTRTHQGVPKTPRARAIAAITQTLREDGQLTPESIDAICETHNLTHRDLLLSQLPKELAEEQNAKFERITPARANLERIHRRAMNGDIKLPDTTATEPEARKLFEEMYYNVATCMECVEHSAAALRESGLARTMNQMRKDVGQSL